jgi:hypothetical protein
MNAKEIIRQEVRKLREKARHYKMMSDGFNKKADDLEKEMKDNGTF